MNSGRHLLRSYLSTTVKNEEVVSYFMGHAGYGESPHESKSSFNIHDATELLQPNLNCLMGDCQWQALQSKIA